MRSTMICLIATLLSSCYTPALITQGPKWAIKGKCEVMHKTDYKKDGPEQKCGLIVEVTLAEGGAVR